MSDLGGKKYGPLRNRFALVQRQMAEDVDAQTYVRLSREYAELEPIVDKIQLLEGLQNEREDLKQLLSDREVESEFRTLAKQEMALVEERLSEAEYDLKVLLLPKDEADDRGVILEVRAGTGGDEAALFAGEIFRMYSYYAQSRGWKLEIVSSNESELGGYREIVASITGNAVYQSLKYESGVHRVQRVPATEAGGRIHTSAVTVAILPEAEDVDVEILEKDLRVDIYRASGAGGQHVNKTDSAVRLTHAPTGLVVAVQDERSQHKNRARAMQLLRTKIYDLYRQKADSERAADRKGQVGSGDRSERIRTYNFPQGRMTDHRIHLTLYKLQQILEGQALGEVIEALSTADRAARLAAISD